MAKENETLPDTARLAPLEGPIDCVLHVPGSKSIANRVLLMAGMAGGASRVSGIPDGDDSRHALAALADLGIAHDELGVGEYRIHGCGHVIPREAATVDIGSAGTVGRFLPGLLASVGRGAWRLISTDQLARRPLGPLVAQLRAWGGDVAPETEGLSFPLRVRGGSLSGGDATMSAAASTQFASGLMLAAPYAESGAVLRITDLDPDDRYIDTTADYMRRFGAGVDCSPAGRERVVTVRPGGYRAADVGVEADLNSALVFLALPLLVGGTVRVANIDGNTRQTGWQMLTLFERLGATVTSDAGGVSVGAPGNRIRGGFDLDMRALAESSLLLAVLAVFADSPIGMTNLAHVRHHETDRLAAIAEILLSLGVTVEEGDDWVRVHPACGSLPAATIGSRGDHRIVTAFSLLGLAADGITITDAAAVSKTFPGFFRMLRSVGASFE
ncbi:MAG: 3-phosphoshikimate 1-carboxyvinyltransferase [Planctomycetaceae bacterium]|nr:3-phosphoshikimate 1-carboxyvinyltransferase [Planctomycetaceae bacterium]